MKFMTTSELLELEKKIKSEKAVEKILREVKPAPVRKIGFFEKFNKPIFYVILFTGLTLVQCIANLMINGEFTIWVDLSHLGY